MSDTARFLECVDILYGEIHARQAALDNLYHAVDGYRREHSVLESGMKQDDGTLNHLYATMLVYAEQAQPFVRPYINQKESV